MSNKCSPGVCRGCIFVECDPGYTCALIVAWPFVCFQYPELESVRLPGLMLIELPCHAGRHATQDASIGGKRKWHMSEFVDSHSGRHGDRSDLSNFHGPFPDNVTTEDLVRWTIDDQFAKTGFFPEFRG